MRDRARGGDTDFLATATTQKETYPEARFLMPIYTEKFVWFCEKGARKKHADFCELTTNKCRLRN